MKCSWNLWLLPKRLGGLFVRETLCLLLLLCPAVYRPAAACEAGAQSETDTLILCRTCGHELALGSDVHSIHSPLALASRNDTLLANRRIHVQLFENPQGHEFEVITFRKADVTKHWPADTHFSWFPGFAWTVATCPRCQAHLGWAFQPSDWPDVITKSRFEESEQTFLALITHRLLREDFASSLLMAPKSFMS